MFIETFIMENVQLFKIINNHKLLIHTIYIIYYQIIYVYNILYNVKYYLLILTL